MVRAIPWAARLLGAHSCFDDLFRFHAARFPGLVALRLGLVLVDEQPPLASRAEYLSLTNLTKASRKAAGVAVFGHCKDGA